MKNAYDCAIDVFMKRFPFVDHTHGFNAEGLTHLLEKANNAAMQRRGNGIGGGLKVCEVGSWMGGSARFFASHSIVSEVVCVDHWDRNQVENWTPGRHPEEWMNFMYEHFLANCLHAGLAKKITPLRITSHEAEKVLEGCTLFDIVYLDGAHRTALVKQDIEDYAPMARILCGDDWCFDKEPENVRQAVLDFAQYHSRTVNQDGNLWWYS